MHRLRAALAERYNIERELGQGGMAIVYAAHDLKHDRDVAIKVLHADLGAALGGERFLSEIKTTAKLQHPHILPLLDSGEADGQLYYVMPLVTGETLRTRLTRERQLPIEDAVRIAREVADALAYAHERGVIHRDIKPENILLQSGHALVADFGIALAVQHAGGARMTQTGLSLGTPQYMSPEQAMGERAIDARSDIYALGAVTYEMLTGEPPFTGPTIQAIVARLMSEEPRALVVQRKSIPDAVEAAVLRALEKVPADRFSSAASFATALSAREVPMRNATRATAMRSSASGRPTTVLVAMSGLLLVSTAAAIWGWLRPRQAAPVVRYRLSIDSVPAVKDWSGEVDISPDGSTIVRSGGPGGVLLVRRRAELQFSLLPGTEGAFGPVFSPDGKRVAYYTNGAVWAAPIDGGPPVILIDSLATSEAITWGSDGFIYRGALKDGVTILGRSEGRLGARFEQITYVDTAAGELTHLHPAPLPDGKTLLFQVGMRDGSRHIAVSEIGSRQHTILMEGSRARYATCGHMLYSTLDGKLWAVPFDVRRKAVKGAAVPVADRIPTTIVGPVDFAISESGTLVYSVEDAGSRRELTWVARNGTRTAFDSNWKGEFASPTLSPDGSRIAVAIRSGSRADIWIKAVAGGSPMQLTSGQRQNNSEPAWTRDGRWVSYLATAGTSNTGDVWRMRADGSGSAERVLQSQRPISEQIWSATGNTLLVRTTTPTSGNGDILALRVGTDTTPAPLVASPRAEYSPVVSPDGRWLAYTSNETGRLTVYVSPFNNPSSAKWVVSTNGGSSPRWSHRGDELFYLDLRSNMVAARITTTATFAVQGTRVLFSAADFVQIAVSRRNYDVSLDDQRFLMVQHADGATRGQIVVVENWAEEMRGKTQP